MGEVPMYVAHFPLLYPRASKSVMQFLARSLDMSVDLGWLDDVIKESDEQVEEIYKKIPAEMRAQLEKLREVRADNAQDETSETHEQEFMEGIGRLLEDIDQSLKDWGTKGLVTFCLRSNRAGRPAMRRR